MIYLTYFPASFTRSSLFPAIELLFTSGHTQNAIVHGGRLDPDVELISKPRLEDLARKIRHLLANRQPLISARQAAQMRYEPEVLNPSEPAMRILVVEDNQDAQTMLCELLMVLGHHAQGAASADEVLKVLASASYDVLLADVSLPGMSGVDLARQVIGAKPGMKVIFSSGYGAIVADEVGCPCLSLPKPYDIEKLQHVLDAVGSAA